MVSPIRKLAFVFLLVSFSAQAELREYDVRFVARFDPEAGVAHATIAITPGEGCAKELDFAMPASRYRAVQGDGKVQRTGDRVLWTVPKAGGTLRYDVVVDHRRPNGSFDARMTKHWAIVRGDALFPPAKIRARKDSEASSRLVIELPPGWTGSQYSPCCFFRSDSSRNSPGSGLGLSLVDAVARLHHAELTLENVEGGLRAILTFGLPAGRIA